MLQQMKGRKKSYSEKDYDVIPDEKKCTICGGVFNNSEYNIAQVRFRKIDGLRVAYLNPVCKKCQAKKHHEWWLNSERKQILNEQRNRKTKICKRCGKELDKSFFSTSYKRYCPAEGNVKNYLRPYCKACQTKKDKEQWQKDKDRLSSPENLAKQRALKKEKFFQYRALHFRGHYDAMEIDGRELTLFLWHLWRRQKGLCALSGRRLTRENAQIDHKEPRRNGINNDFDNLQWTTKAANHAKNQMTPQEFRQFISDIYNTIN